MKFFRNLNGTFLSHVLFGSPTCWRWASPGEGYSRNASCALNLISTFLYRKWSRNCLSFQNTCNHPSIFPEHLQSPLDLSRTPAITPRSFQNTCNHPSIRSFWSIFRFLRSIWSNIVCCFFLPLYYLSVFELRILITRLVSSNFSFLQNMRFLILKIVFEL